VGSDEFLELFKGIYAKPSAEVEQPAAGAEVSSPSSPFNFHFKFGSDGPGINMEHILPMFSPNGPSYWRASVPWWKGENVCVEESEVEEEERTDASSGAAGLFTMFNMEQTSCGEEGGVYQCTTRVRRRGISRTVTKEYRCCHGYSREKEGCKLAAYTNMTSTLEAADRQTFLTTLRNYMVTDDMLNSNNITVFAPSDEALEDYITDMMEVDTEDILNNEVYRRKRSFRDVDMTDLLTAHIAEGIHYANALKDEQILAGKWSDSSVRINIYGSSPPLMTANCARVEGPQLPALSGIIHTVDRVVKPATQTIWALLQADDQFSTLRKLVASSPSLLSRLSSPGQLTLLAPSDAAFAAMPGESLAVLAQGPCLPAILKNHLLPNVICSAAVVNEESRTLNLLDKYLKVNLLADSAIAIDGALLVAKDLIATNGVVHVIDKVLVPTEAKSVLDVLESQNLTSFLEMLRLADMTQEIEAMPDTTIFAPNNAAFTKLEPEYLNELKADVPRLQTVLRHHLSTAPLHGSRLGNNRMLATHSGHSIRMNVYAGPLVINMFRPVVRRSRITANCAPVTLTDARACGAQVHVVDSLLMPAEHDLMQGLRQDPAFSIFAGLVQNSSLSTEYASTSVPLTVLAPSDHVFRTLPREELDAFFSSPSLQEELVQRHTLREHMCCAGITPSSLFRNLVRTAHGSTLHFRQTPEGFLKAGHARITRCGDQHTNGVRHTVDRLFVEPHVVDTGLKRRWNNDPTRPFHLSLDSLGKLFH